MPRCSDVMWTGLNERLRLVFVFVVFHSVRPREEGNGIINIYSGRFEIFYLIYILANKANSLCYRKIDGDDLELISSQIISCTSSWSHVLLTGFSPVCVSVFLQHHCTLSHSLLLSHKPGEKLQWEYSCVSSLFQDVCRNSLFSQSQPPPPLNYMRTNVRVQYLKLTILLEKIPLLYTRFCKFAKTGCICKY